MTLPVSVLGYVMSAGRGRRLGGVCKGRVMVDGQPMVLRQISAMLTAGVDQVSVVVGHEASQIIEICQNIEGPSVSILNLSEHFHSVSNDPELQFSIRYVIKDATSRLSGNRELSGILISLVDLPLLSPGDIRAVITASGNRANVVVIPLSSAQQPGHPIWLPRELVLKLNLDIEDLTLRDVLRGNDSSMSCDIQHLRSDLPGYFVDFDTPEDIHSLQERYELHISVPDRYSIKN